MPKFLAIDPYAPAKGAPPRSLLAFMLWIVRGAWPAILVGLGLSVLAGGMDVVNAKLMGTVIDRAVSTDTATFFSENMPLVIGFAAFFLILRPIVLGASAYMQSGYLAPLLWPMFLSRLFTWTLGHSVQFFDNDFAGRIAQKHMQTARAMSNFVTEMINVVAYAMAAVVGSALLLVTIDWRIGVMLLVWLMAYLLLIRWFIPRVRSRSRARASARAMVSGHVVDVLSNVKTVKLFARVQQERETAQVGLESLRGHLLAFGALSSWFRVSLMSLAGVLPVMLVLGTLWLRGQGGATTGDVAAAGAVALRLAQMTGWVSFSLMGLYADIGEVEDGMATISPPHGLSDHPDAAPLEMAQGITFEDVSFGYGNDIGGVSGLNLHIQPGEKLGIVGASGAGKSTLVSLLLRLYDAEQGRILVGGQDVVKLTQDSLRSAIAMVTQDTAMFNRSARDNILYGAPDASEDQMIAAAKQAEAHDFILTLRDHKGRTGYDAHLGERGVKLSGGQRQRIALARAILKDAPILVLDEATSALDSEVEADIQEALNRVMHGKTVLAIAHRLSTLVQMDRIVVMEAGTIVEEGTHDQLLALEGRYARFWARQSGGFIATEDAAE